MRKLLFTSVIMLICSLTALATTLTSQGNYWQSSLNLLNRLPLEKEQIGDITIESSKKYVTLQAGELSPTAQKIWQLSHPGIQVPTPKLTVLKAPRRENAVTYSVMPILAEYPEMGLRPGQYAFAFLKDNPEEMYQALYFGPDFSIPFSLPEGIYDFILFFYGNECDGIRCILKEDIEVKGDMEITADPTEAIEHIMFRPLSIS